MKRSTWVRLTAAWLTVCLCLSGMTACKTTETSVSYTLTVQSEGGMPLADVRVDVFGQGETADLVWAGMTDENGTVAFTAGAASPLEAVVSELPAGYTPQPSYLLEAETTTVRVSASLLQEDLGTRQLSLGDMMCDITIESVDGTTYTVSELLQTKKAVVLNFWFEGCMPCRAEFPYLQKAYAKYAQDIEVLAINPYDGTTESVAAYAQALDLTFPFVKADGVWQSSMNLTAFPTTVVIDRYGMIALVHRGSVTEEGVFETVFDHFTSDEYVQGAVRNIGDLTSK